MSSAKRVVVIGGGFGGLSAGVRLAESGFEVLLFERRGRLGGRAYSFTDPTTGDIVDNGQHLFMGCYRNTIAFLDKIGCLDRLKFQTKPRVDFLDRETGYCSFECPPLPAPFHALVGLFQMRGISIAEKFRTLNVGLAIKKNENGVGDCLTVSEWLDRLGQSERIKRRFWYPMMIATLNENPTVASAKMMKAVLREAFGSGTRGTRIGIARAGLSELYTEGARRFIEARKGRILLDAEVKRIVIAGDQASGVELKNNESVEANYVISAVPPAALTNMLPESLRAGELAAVSSLRSSPIVSINLWFDRPVMEREFVGLLGTHSQWAFNRDLILETRTKSNLVAVVISAAHDYVGWSRQQLVDTVRAELQDLLPESRSATLVHSVIVKEREATLSHTVESDGLRPGSRTSISNFVLAGDWINTGLPATIESAVMSGDAAAEIVVESSHREKGRESS